MPKNIGILLIGIVIGLVAGLFVFQQTFVNESGNQTQTYLSESEVTASLMIDFGNGKIITCNNKTLKEGETIFNLLEVCSKDQKNPFELKYKTYSGLGVFIEQIGGLKSNGDKYWQYWVNNEYSQVGASEQKLNHNDIVEWKFIKSVAQ